MRYLLCLLWVLCVAGRGVAQAQPASLSQPPVDAGIEGTWSPLPNEAGRDGQTPQGAWNNKADGKELSFILEAGQTGTWQATRAEPLPEGNWTLDLVLTAPPYSANFQLLVGPRLPQGRRAPGSWSLDIEPRSSENGVRLYTYGNGIEGNMGQMSNGTTHWLRLTYDSAARRLQAWINGRPFRGSATGLALVREPITIKAVAASRRQEPHKLTLHLFRVHPALPPVLPISKGLAFKGWQRAKPSAEIVVPPELILQLETLSQTADVEAEGRAGALAALLLAEWATKRQVSAERWKNTADFAEKSLDINLKALSVLTPIAAACANDKEREQTQRWTRVFFDGLTGESQKQAEEQVMLLRMALCDPSRAATQFLKGNMSHRAVFTLVEDLKSSDPMLAQALYQSVDTNLGWILPELQQVAPLQAKIIVERLLAGQTLRGSGTLPTYELTLAAYRMANHDLPLAVALLERLPPGSSRTDTLRLVSEALQFTTASKMPAAQKENWEAALRKMLALWQPSEGDDSPVPLLAQLAAWQIASGQKEAAQSTLREASGKIGKLPHTHFRDTWAIARAAFFNGQLPEAQEWWDKTKTLLAKREINVGGFSGQPPAANLVRDLLRAGQRDSALKLLRDLPVNSETHIAWELLLRAIVRDEPSQLGAFFAALPASTPDYRRPEMARTAVRRLALSDIGAARALAAQLAAQMPEAARPEFEKSLGLPDEKALSDEISNTLKSLRPGAALFADNSVLDRAARLPLKEVAALEPLFSAHRSIYAQLCLYSIANAAGLNSDSLWLRFRDAESQSGWSSPWGAGNLESAIRVDQRNRREAEYLLR
ncbi:MAG TPA: hypothetical protein VGB77_02205 [Abditibacteriaceae bacterium]|jgi:hypothetical protein